MIRADTIVAISTAQGEGAIGIVRLSGPQALSIADQLFSGKRTPSRTRGGRFLYGRFLDREGETIDEGIVLVFKGPHSYTGEDVAELQTHGSVSALGALLTRCVELGARLAKPGEFTLRAFLEGRMDLNQAEAVNSLIHAQTDTARRQATLGLQGALSKRLDGMVFKLARTMGAIQAMLDYPEEGVPEEDRIVPLLAVQNELNHLLDTARAGKLAQQGARLALLGRPNAGKSSLLNALLGYERSIVTPIAGTTRDYLEAHMELVGVPITLIDTAGVRETADVIEAAGVERALQLGENADLVMLLEDASAPREPLDVNVPEDRLIRLQTKTDLGQVWHDDRYQSVSAITGAGLPELRDRLREKLLGDQARHEVWLSSERQVQAVTAALEHVQGALTLPDELASYEIELALNHLAELSGKNVSEEVIEQIFRNFCVGK
ncbi:tRNA uridine-5-carboxymethylaminomethyl(34) synthesis GTPase MnmE [Deinococcus roseus]|uniref:tRNA modification GTPase MnmE n=1 Tax=Deinococcus roseus TaxID=392414 RepID=A0ABQ2D1M2_9DEIO|nr:tRNA uridine-5-carboxymethylaminomethyl(34) synthesis GTPase MnmE [Deinococcus roseus]GGJ41891.1 tRNA modification GTPase MnmE [Deinococcus roseus]